jgi:cytochrome oxidase Cu insertion factor (SCO1/SenC/PrrC family)
MTGERRGTPALVAMALIIVITGSWWALALWPMAPETPEWLVRTRLACFGASRDGLPDGGGWMLLIGQPLGMVALLMAVWGAETRAGLRRLLARASGQITVGVVTAAVVIGLAGVVLRVREAAADPFVSRVNEGIAGQLTRVNDPVPAVGLVDQRGDTLSLGQYHGRAVLVTFAFGHCETVCPLVVHSAIEARDQLATTDSVRTPAIVVVTLDPWRDTPSRLASIARQWGLTGDAHILSGTPAQVEHVLNRWRVPRVRNVKTGDVSHPSLVYVIAPNGRIAYVVPGTTEQIIAAVLAL